MGTDINVKSLSQDKSLTSCQSTRFGQVDMKTIFCHLAMSFEEKKKKKYLLSTE